jgi:hypothetical protein
MRALLVGRSNHATAEESVDDCPRTKQIDQRRKTTVAL